MTNKLDGRRSGGRQPMAGFSLIEVMVVVAIIAILASIALPSYNEHVRKTRRAAGGACAVAASQQLERYYTVQLTYDGAPAGNVLDNVCDPDTLKYYTIGRIINAANPRVYSVTATPAGKQQGDSCGTLSINQAGVKSPATDGCW
ncbi:type IV pilin protein [Luteimonas notoginsengisoli]|jgi:type IV pilus assembly protein PilE|uniref:Type IV pilin protein n=1 Tax=Luteimonas notoginsengisoli TaxID=1578200 RepID=A0ABV7UPX6_9GAMM